MRKPVNVTVSNASVLVAPAVVPKPGDIAAFVALMALAYGDIVRSAAGVLYWCTAAGDAGADEPTHYDGDAASGTATLRAMPAYRQYLALVNDSSSVMYVGLGNAAEANKGIRLNANGGSVEFKGKDVPQGAIYAIAATAGSNVLGVQEG